MTQKAPERFWLKWKPGKAITQGPLTEYPDYTEYVHVDHALALVAAAYEDCWEQGKQAGRFAPDVPDDEQAALVARDARIKQEARNEALREVINLVNGCDRVSEVQPAIENLITED